MKQLKKFYKCSKTVGKYSLSFNSDKTYQFKLETECKTSIVRSLINFNIEEAEIIIESIKEIIGEYKEVEK